MDAGRLEVEDRVPQGWHTYEPATSEHRHELVDPTANLADDPLHDADSGIALDDRYGCVITRLEYHGDGTVGGALVIASHPDGGAPGTYSFTQTVFPTETTSSTTTHSDACRNPGTYTTGPSDFEDGEIGPTFTCASGTFSSYGSLPNCVTNDPDHLSGSYTYTVSSTTDSLNLTTTDTSTYTVSWDFTTKPSPVTLTAMLTPNGSAGRVTGTGGLTWPTALHSSQPYKWDVDPRHIDCDAVSIQYLRRWKGRARVPRIPPARSTCPRTRSLRQSSTEPAP